MNTLTGVGRGIAKPVPQFHHLRALRRQTAKRPSKNILAGLFGRTLDRIALEKTIPGQVAVDGNLLRMGGERIDLTRYRRIVMAAFGKAGFQMAGILCGLLDGWPVSGVASGIGSPHTIPGIRLFQGAHPYPDRESFRAGDAVVETLREVSDRDLVLYLLSGGGSSICEKPVSPEIGLEDHRLFYQTLLTCGASIVDVNYLRKHVSAVKAGRLTALAYPARQVTLYVSDAPPGHPSNVASGPTMPDESSIEDCYAIVERLGLEESLPPPIRRMFDTRTLPETPKPGDAIFGTSSWHCLLTPEDAAAALVREAAAEGWIAETDLSIQDDCPLGDASSRLLGRLERMRSRAPGRPVALVSGGEYSCPVRGNGIGGRNQAFVLDCVEKIAGRDIAVLSAGTDGIDGISPAAGAVADGRTLVRARRFDMDPAEYAQRSDSHSFFSRLGDAIVCGPTGNNVRDLRLLVAW